MTPKGGARQGAGRKPLRGERKRQVGIGLPPSLDDWLITVGEAKGMSRSELIAEALEAQRTEPARGSTVPERTGPPAVEAPEVAAYRELMAALGEALAVNNNAGNADRELRLPVDVWKTLETYGKRHALHRDAAAVRLIRLGAVAAEFLEVPGPSGSGSA